MRRVLLCPPAYFEVRDVKNPHMTGSKVDRARAQQQWDGLRHALQEAGVLVETIAPVPDLEDMVFTANQVFVGHHPKIGKFIVPSEMRFQSRQREVPYFVDWLSKRGYKVVSLDLARECLEGHGDLIWHPDRSQIWAGYGFRSTRGAIEKFAAAMRDFDIPVIPLQLIDERCYHLDTCFSPLKEDAVLIYPGAFAPDSLAAIRRGWKRVHALEREEAYGFMANGIVANGHYITPACDPESRSHLARGGSATDRSGHLRIRKIRGQRVLHESVPGRQSPVRRYPAPVCLCWLPTNGVQVAQGQIRFLQVLPQRVLRAKGACCSTTLENIRT
jgi:N-dimethylarginine dimethylaminohydrolase